MPLDRKHPTRAQMREAKWDALNAAPGGAFQSRVHVLLAEQPDFAPLDARIKTVFEEGWLEAKIQDALGIAEQTLYNHKSKIRKIAGVDATVDFRSLFLPPKK